MESAKKGRKIMSVSFRPETYEAIVKYCRSHTYNRSKFVEEAVLVAILSELQQEASNEKNT